MTTAGHDVLPDRVCLVIPPSGFLLDERVFPSLGVLRVAAALEDRGVVVDLVDLSGIANYEETLASYLKGCDVPVVGFTSTTPQMPATVRLIEVARQHAPAARVVVGGPHITLVASAAAGERRAGRSDRGQLALQELQRISDVLVAGDGEQAMFVAMGPDAPAFVDGDDPKGGLFMSNTTYEQSALPARHLIDLASYHYEIEGRKATSLVAQLGCPFECGFCGGRSSKSLRMIRTRTTANIIEEIAYLYETYGYTGFMFYDDELNVNKQMVSLMEEIASLQKRLGAEFRLRGFVKAELFTPQQAEAMYAAGFRWLLTGFESGSPRILDNMNKKATRDDNTRAVEIARSAGLKVKALMSLGHPGESAATVDETRQWLLDVKPDDFDCTLITTYPGSPYYDQAVPSDTRDGVYTYTVPKVGDRLHAFDVDFLQTADYYKGDPDGGYRAYVYTDELTDEDLVSARQEVEESVRQALGIPFNAKGSARTYEHSMGMGRSLPDFILRSTRHSGVQA